MKSKVQIMTLSPRKGDINYVILLTKKPLKWNIIYNSLWGKDIVQTWNQMYKLLTLNRDLDILVDMVETNVLHTVLMSEYFTKFKIKILPGIKTGGQKFELVTWNSDLEL